MMGSWSYEWPTASIFSVPTISNHNSEKKLQEFWLHQQHRIPANLFLSQKRFLSLNFRKRSSDFKDFRRFSEDLRTFPKISEDVPTNFEHLRSHLKGDKFSVFWKNYDTKSTLSPLMKYLCGNCRNWISFIDHVLNANSSGFMSQAWEIVLDAWDRCLYTLFLIRMLFFRPRLNILILVPIFGRKYSSIILSL